MPKNTQKEIQMNQDLPGSIRTMKDDIEVSKLSPEERLAQSGNFVEAQVSLEQEEPKTFDTSSKPFTQQESSEDVTPPPVLPDTDLKEEVPEAIPLKISPIESESFSKPTQSEQKSEPQTLTMDDLGLSNESEDQESLIGGFLNVDKETDSDGEEVQFTMENASEEEIVQVNSSQPKQKEPVSPILPASEVSPVKHLKQKLSAIPSPGKSMDMKTEAKKPSYTGLSLDEEKNSNSLSQDSIGGLGLGEDETQPVQPKKSRKRKSSSPTKLAILMLLLITAGVTFYTFQNGSISIPSFGGTNTPAPVVVTPPVESPAEVPVVVTGTEPIRSTNSLTFPVVTTQIRSDILSELSGSTDSLVAITLQDDQSNDLSFAEIADAMGLVLPETISEEILDFWVYVYNQEGIYKIAAVLQLNEGVSAPDLVQTWSTSIPRDMTGFSLSSSSRGVTTPEIKSVEVELDGVPATNYFYNYEAPTNSIDVSSVGEYILLGSSQETMESLISLFDIN